MADMLKYVDLDFNKAQGEYWIKSPDFYVYSWRFIRSIINSLSEYRCFPCQIT